MLERNSFSGISVTATFSSSSFCPVTLLLVLLAILKILVESLKFTYLVLSETLKTFFFNLDVGIIASLCLADSPISTSVVVGRAPWTLSPGNVLL